jgi:branched-chain amino acid transport system permease protein
VPFYVIVMSVIGGRRHWLGPVLGATLIYTTNDRLTNLGAVEVNQLLVGLLLIVVVVGLRAGIVAQLFRRARATALVATSTALIFGVSGLSSDLITTFAWGMLAGLALLLLPERVYRFVRGAGPLRWRTRTRGGDKNKPASSPTRPVSRGVL